MPCWPASPRSPAMRSKWRTEPCCSSSPATSRPDLVCSSDIAGNAASRPSPSGSPATTTRLDPRSGRSCLAGPPTSDRTPNHRQPLVSRKISADMSEPDRSDGRVMSRRTGRSAPRSLRASCGSRPGIRFRPPCTTYSLWLAAVWVLPEREFPMRDGAGWKMVHGSARKAAAARLKACFWLARLLWPRWLAE